MVHGENTAKMEFRTANVKILLQRTKRPPFPCQGPERLIREGLRVKIRRKSPELPHGNQGIHRVLAGSERLTRIPSKVSERERWATV
jgi:hypothetical protein